MSWLHRTIILFLLVASTAAVAFRSLLPAGLDHPGIRAGLGFGLLFLILILMWTARSLRTSAVVGAALGLLVGLLSSWLLAAALGDPSPAVRWGATAVLGWLGLALGAALGPGFRLESLASRLRADPVGPAPKILDTSVIIDGRIADLAETGFFEGTFLVPAFVLRELQRIADSTEPLRRARGRKGLEVLERMQSSRNVRVQLGEDDIHGVAGVDAKLVELAVQMRGAILTNDMNLNKVASLRGVRVLSLHELAGAMRPVLLPGEALEVYILKEGKEHGQGVAYLDDGTMVVVDDGRRRIGETVSVSVTSVLQTSAGTMYFARQADDAVGREVRTHRAGQGRGGA